MKVCVVTSFLSAGEAVAYYLTWRVTDFLDISAKMLENGNYPEFCITLIEYDNQRPIPGDGFQQSAYGPENLFE